MGEGVGRATGSQGLGFLTKIILNVADQADIRSWNLLPRDLQVARIPVAPGTYTVRVHPIGAGDLPEKTVQVGPRKKVFLSFRYMP